MDVAIAREVFTFLCDMGRRFHASSAEMERWNAILQKLQMCIRDSIEAVSWDGKRKLVYGEK